VKPRFIALGALTLVVVLVVALVAGAGHGQRYRLLFQNAGQLVNGDRVQVGGVAVGSVRSIDLAPDGQAQITIDVSPPLAPLHAGTTAAIRATSLSGVANRYVALQPGPNNRATLRDGATLASDSTHGIVDLDQLFDTFDPRTRRALGQVVQGSATQYAVAAGALRDSARYLSPTLAASDHVFAELARDQDAFTRFLVSTARAVSTIGARRDRLAGLVGNGNTVFTALGSQRTALAQALSTLPSALRHGTAALADLRPALESLTRLVDVSKRDTRTLEPFLRRLRPLLAEALAPVRDLRTAVVQPGAGNDLIDALRALPGLAQTLRSASPDTVSALNSAAPVSAQIRPYAPDLVGFLRDFGQTAAFYDANGHYARAQPVFASFALNGSGELAPVSPAQGIARLQRGLLRRCPGAATQAAPDGSSPFTDAGAVDCNPAQVPVG
jgi:phospholipid/cholesterol/gamma-HCH transport system substrate-binding protein